MAAAAFGGAFLLAKADHDWAAVASVNSHPISRRLIMRGQWKETAIRGRAAGLGGPSGPRLGQVQLGTLESR
jgi:hypothetical protein